MMMHSWSGGWWWVFGVVIWILVAVTLILFIRWLWMRADGVSEDYENPLDILKRRYARGEISREEFEEIKSDLV
ncbi:hypothetical protein AKJ57_04905 [candidate division MSBL1 archaeon SCGC-AAA259A05]|uniref:SHOCT domain-containing protein n=1 Tax=candidate division MSBL1 archaeon SCGC-AAA259A05 TaxID=1698259 RepID=A0A133U6I1_9EURY|nr:hypothetical protein AKJ57_04905 [candidate division MSBL1 archaeon SCGC-AAA259A05]